MASRFWVGGAGTWDTTTTTNWAASSGGGGGSSVPTSADDVFFDGNSGTGNVQSAGQTTLNCGTLDFTNYTGTFTGNTTTMNVFGGLKLYSGMTWSMVGSFALAFKGTSSFTLTTAGISINAPISINGAGLTITLADSFNSNSTFTLTQGTFDASTFNVTVSGTTITGATTRTLNMGTGTWSVGSSGSAAWNLFTVTGLTLNAQSSTLKFTDTSNIVLTFTGGGKTYNKVWFSRGASTGQITIVSNNTFAEFKDTGTVAHTLAFTTGSTQHIAAWTVSGTSGNLITVTSTATTTHNLIKDGGGTVSADFLVILHSVATPANTWYAGTNSTNSQATASAGSGWIFTAVPVISNVIRLVSQVIHRASYW